MALVQKFRISSTLTLSPVGRNGAALSECCGWSSAENPYRPAWSMARRMGLEENSISRAGRPSTSRASALCLLVPCLGPLEMAMGLVARLPQPLAPASRAVPHPGIDRAIKPIRLRILKGLYFTKKLYDNKCPNNRHYYKKLHHIYRSQMRVVTNHFISSIKMAKGEDCMSNPAAGRHLPSPALKEAHRERGKWRVA